MHFLFILLLLRSLSTSATTTSPQYTACTPITDYACGPGTFNISYPFLIDGRLGTCGYPGYNLNCTTESNDLTVVISGKPYQVLAIDYLNRLLTVVDITLLRKTCSPQQFTNTSIDQSLYQLSDRNRNVTIYYNCATPSSFSVPYIVDATCLVTDNSRSYYKVNDGSSPDVFLGTCASNVGVPLSFQTADDLLNGKLGFSQAMQQGFYVSWNAGKDWCSGCTYSGGFCGTGLQQHVCFCANGTSSDSCSQQEQTGTEIFL